jgi:hypothetical protein
MLAAKKTNTRLNSSTSAMTRSSAGPETHKAYASSMDPGESKQRQKGSPARKEPVKMYQGEWKLISPKDPSQHPELYQIVKDPTEEKNLAGQFAERVRQLRNLLDRWWDPAASNPAL